MTQEEIAGLSQTPVSRVRESHHFLASQNGKVVGRITAIVNNRHTNASMRSAASLGSLNRLTIARWSHALFEKACACLKSQGMTAVRGPCNPSLNYDLGTLIDGFDTPPTFMMTYNPPYHDDLISSYGFAKVEDLYAYEGDVSMLANIDPKLAFVIGEIKRRFQCQVRKFDPKNFVDEVKLFLDIYNRSLVGTRALCR